MLPRPMKPISIPILPKFLTLQSARGGDRRHPRDGSSATAWQVFRRPLVDILSLLILSLHRNGAYGETQSKSGNSLCDQRCRPLAADLRRPQGATFWHDPRAVG